MHRNDREFIHPCVANASLSQGESCGILIMIAAIAIANIHCISSFRLPTLVCSRSLPLEIRSPVNALLQPEVLVVNSEQGVIVRKAVVPDPRVLSEWDHDLSACPVSPVDVVRNNIAIDVVNPVVVWPPRLWFGFGIAFLLLFQCIQLLLQVFNLL